MNFSFVFLSQFPKQCPTKNVAFLLAMGFGLVSILSSCAPGNSKNVDSGSSLNNSSASNANSTQSTQRNVIRIGYQKYGTLNILKARGNLDQRLKSQGVSVQWLLFPAGPQLLEALNAGSIDYGHAGEAPPIFAQAAGAPFLYVAHEPPNPQGEAILVPKNSQIKTVADLKGKRVALNKGSNVHFLLVQALAAAGLKYSDIQPVYVTPADASAAFEQGSIDAWVIWDPYLTVAERSIGARVLQDAKGLAANREFYLAAKPLVEQYPTRVQAILEETQKVDDWAKSHPKQVATLLSPQLGIDIPTLTEVSKKRPYGVQPIQPDIIAYQQKEANTFFQLGLLPKPIDVKADTSASLTKLLTTASK